MQRRDTALVCRVWVGAGPDQAIDGGRLCVRVPDIRIRRIVKRLGAAAISRKTVGTLVDESLDDFILEARSRHVQGSVARVHIMRDRFKEVRLRAVPRCSNRGLLVQEGRRRVQQARRLPGIARDDRVHEVEKRLVGRCGSRAVRHDVTLC